MYNLRKQIESAINATSAESGSDTPDFILSEYLTDCLTAYDKAVVAREKWYGNQNHSPRLVKVNNTHDEREIAHLISERDAARQIAEFLRNLIPIKSRPLPWENSRDN